MRNWLNPLNAELNPIRHLLALLGAHCILHVSGVRFKLQVIEADIQESSGSTKQYQIPFCHLYYIFFLSQHLPVSVTWMWVSKCIVHVRSDFRHRSAAKN